MNADEVYRHIVVQLARAGIVGPHLENLPLEGEFSEEEAERLAREAIVYIEAKEKHARKWD